MNSVRGDRDLNTHLSIPIEWRLCCCFFRGLLALPHLMPTWWNIPVQCTYIMFACVHRQRPDKPVLRWNRMENSNNSYINKWVPRPSIILRHLVINRIYTFHTKKCIPYTEQQQPDENIVYVCVFGAWGYECWLYNTNSRTTTAIYSVSCMPLIIKYTSAMNIIQNRLYTRATRITNTR